MIDKKKINKIKRKISREFPEFKGIEPRVTEKDVKPQDEWYKKLNLGVPKHFRHIYRLQFTKSVKTADRVPIERILMVTLDENFKIIKVIESR